MLAFRSSAQQAGLLFYGNILHLVALFLPVSFLYLNATIVNTNVAKYINYIAFVIAFISAIFLFADIPGFSLIDNIYRIRYSSEPIIIFNKIPYYWYLLYISLSFLSGFYLLYGRYKSALKDGDEKNKVLIFFVTSGIMVPAIISVITNLLLPYFGYFDLNWVGQLSASVAPLFVLYAISRYKVFNFELFAAEILVLVLVIQSFVSVLQADGIVQVILNLIILFFVIALGWWLLQNIKEEKIARSSLEEKIRELHKINEHVRNLTRKKTEFLSIATHQLRAPLTVMKGQLSLILEGSYAEVPQALVAPLQKIYSSIEQLTDTVTDFLNVSRIEQGRLKYNMAKVDIVSLLEDIYEDLSTLAHSKKIDLRYKKCKDLKDSQSMVFADKAKLHHVFYNLVENSIKYTEKGFVEISMCVLRKHFIRVEIKDSGVGIDADDLKTLFNKFERARNIHGVNVQGSGLGLYIAREILHAHNGRIWAKSAGAGKGSTFFVEMPLVISK